MGKIGDLWVRLGLKSDEYKKGMNDAKKETQNFSGKLEKMKAGALAVWAAIGTAVVKVAKDTINATNAMGDAWAQNMAKIKTSYRSVIAQMSTNSKREKGWWLRLFNPNDSAGYDVGANAKAAGDAAKKMTAAFDAEFELVNSVRLQRACIQEELNQLYIDMRDTTLSAAARQSAMERYKALLEPLAQAEVAVYQNMLDSAVEAWQAGNMDILSRKYSSAELTDFFSMYGTDPNKARSQYGELADVYELRQNDEFNALLVETMLKLKNAQNEMSNTEKEMARVALSIKKAFETIGEGATQMVALPTATTQLKEFAEELEALDLDEIASEMGIEDGMASINDEMRAFLESWEQDVNKVAQLNDMLSQSFVSAFGNGMQALTDLMFNLDNADMKNVMAAFIAPLADTMKQMGGMIMAEGIAMKAFKESFKNPWAAIAAGAALIAVGSAVSSGLQKLTANPAGGGGTTASGGSYGSSELQNYESTLTVEVVGRISGNDIVISGQKTNAANAR